MKSLHVNRILPSKKVCIHLHFYYAQWNMQLTKNSRPVCDFSWALWKGNIKKINAVSCFLVTQETWSKETMKKYGQSKERFWRLLFLSFYDVSYHQIVPMATVRTLKEDSREVIVLTGPERWKITLKKEIKGSEKNPPLWSLVIRKKLEWQKEN